MDIYKICYLYKNLKQNNGVYTHNLPRVLQDILKFEENSDTGHLLDPTSY